MDKTKTTEFYGGLLCRVRQRIDIVVLTEIAPNTLTWHGRTVALTDKGRHRPATLRTAMTSSAGPPD